MPIYQYRCQECGFEFELLARTFDSATITCTSCHSANVKRCLSPPLVRIGKSSEPTTEFSAKDAEINYYKKRKDFEKAAKAAEKAGKSDWEVKDLYRKAGRKT